MSKIYGNMIGAYSNLGRTLVIEDDEGNALMTGVVTDQEVIFDAIPADVKIGKTFASDSGVAIGTDTKTYRTIHGTSLVLPGENFSILLEEYDSYNYTQFQAMISVFNTTKYDSVEIDRISLYDSIYNVDSNIKLSEVTKNTINKTIDFNLTNDTDSVYIIHFNTYKEE